METLEQRVRRYLLARLRRRAVLDLYETAATAGLLERGVVDNRHACQALDCLDQGTAISDRRP